MQVSTTKPSVGVPFEIAFHMNAAPQDFTPPSFKDFEVISGPNQSQNIQFINGNLSQSFSISYVLIPKKEGPVVIGAAKAVFNGQSVYSSPITLDVQKGSSNYSAHQNRGSNSGGNSSTLEVDKEDIFVRTSVNKKQCYLGEQITLTQKIYTRVELRGIQNVKFPHLEGFWAKNQDKNNNIQLHIENIDGINYYVGEISTQYIFPQRSGKLTIPPLEIECVIRKRSNRPPRDIFEQFFGVNAYEDRVVTLKSQPINIQVDDLPSQDKPANFSGAVGTNFSFKVEINRNKVPANDAINLKVTISGNGNIPLIDAPKINFPSEFETYDPKITENISTSNGVSGTKTFEYLIIPRQEGTYKLDDIQFSYFNLNSKSYITIPSPEIIIEVTPSTNPNNNAAQVYQQFKQEIKNEDNDIHFIKAYPYTITNKNETFFNSRTHLVTLIFPYFAMLALLGFYNYQKNLRQDWASYQQKRASKIAHQYLRSADQALKNNQNTEFYTAILQALENYFIYKFKVPKSELTKDKIKDIFNKYQIPESTQHNYFEILDTCEMAKYSPIQSVASLNELFAKAQQIITQIEQHRHTV
ncbi:MAG: aerotolerance-like protein [Bacteroidia bacterium]|nr:MAG: aerotolerance-like protein [Bacteroidia bacterium]